PGMERPFASYTPHRRYGNLHDYGCAGDRSRCRGDIAFGYGARAGANVHADPYWRGCPYPRSTNSTMLPSGSLTMAIVVPGLMVVLGRVKATCAASNRWITSSRLVTTKVR